MRIKFAKPTPPVPADFFSSLSPEQQKQLTHLLKAYRYYYEQYYSFSGEMIKKNGFINGVFEVRLCKDVIEPAGMTRNMFRMMVFIWFLQKSPRFKDIRLTNKEIKQQLHYMGRINRLWPFRNIIYLTKYGWLTAHKFRNKQKQFFVSEKGINLITAYSLRFQELYHEVFEPLHL